MSQAPIDIERLVSIMQEAGRTEVMPRFRNLGAGDIREKTSATDIVTEADEASEAHIRKAVQELAPNALFVGEETVAKDPSVLDKLKGADLAVVVDPIDGTSNYAAGVPLFSVMAAVISKGEVVAGAIHDPVSGDTVMAERGAGAWWDLGKDDKRRIKVAWPVPLDEAVGIVSATYFEEKAKHALLPRLENVKIFANYRNAGHEYKMLATGGAHFVLYSRTMPWDHAPGVMIVQEAGGHVAFDDGTPYDPTRYDGVLLSACSRQTWKSAASQLLGVGAEMV
ncbi:fructose-1,6-bisphosphatase [Fulvimarina manganoxydans]|uniref:Fructose-1,6-bisphosphatase n=1 Tax=Fulvimarina manganoxydans TaxID=937218 RepID=A0A1W2DPB1_9HYPH|nr:inositol monophosphatase family protein [Fulvimarina manganoxydans]MEE2952641.1 inositol monophosphatase family protein [Pseudomonadota bacterium]SMC98868.1 fructose-1,6-bisphosphatase [Fulvimarina manganoxydans]